MSEKVLHRVAKTDVLRGWSVKQDRDDGPLHARYDDINYSVDRYELVKELARLAARIAELEAENAALRKCVEEADAMREEITCPNTGDEEPAENCCDACWSMIHYDAARAEVDK